MTSATGVVRVVLAGLCGSQAGTVIEWRLDRVKATSACRAAKSLYDVTADDFIKGLIETWPPDLLNTAANPKKASLSILYNGRLVSGAIPMSDMFPKGSLDITAPSRTAAIDGSAAVVLHLVFRGPSASAQGDNSAQQPANKPTPVMGSSSAQHGAAASQRSDADTGCCTVA